MAIQRGNGNQKRVSAITDADTASAMTNSEDNSDSELKITGAQSADLDNTIINQNPAISESMTENYRQCNLLFSKTKAFITQDDWEQGRPAFDQFRNAMKQHFSMGEVILFPNLEQCTGQTLSATSVLMKEHARMRQLLSDMEEALAREDRDRYLGFAKNLMVTIQQHITKVDQILLTDQ